MYMVKLPKLEHLATFMWVIDGNAAFSYGDENSPRFFYMNAEDWLHMGKPDTITLTIEPKDALNGQ
jgi:hypothetical protein